MSEGQASDGSFFPSTVQVSSCTLTQWAVSSRNAYVGIWESCPRSKLYERSKMQRFQRVLNRTSLIVVAEAAVMMLYP